jgi:leucine dehydrogenase
VGARVLVSDVDEEAARQVAAETGGSWLEPEAVMNAECDMLAPCALGGVLNDHTIPKLRCAAVVGSANNQLAEDRHALMLAERGILYAPDFVVSAGGVINISVEFGVNGYEPDVARSRVDAIESQMSSILVEAGARGITPTEAATEIALERIERARADKSVRLRGLTAVRASR